MNKLKNTAKKGTGTCISGRKKRAGKTGVRAAKSKMSELVPVFADVSDPVCTPCDVSPELSYQPSAPYSERDRAILYKFFVKKDYA